MPHAKAPPSVLFVCTGNICRSPMAHALLLHKAAALDYQVQVDSAAVSGAELGNPVDRRALTELRRRGIGMPPHRARRVTATDFAHFDLLLGMTAEHVRILQGQAPASASKVDLLMRHADHHGAIDVPDPWFGSARDFVGAFDMIEAGVDGLLQRLMTGPT